MGFMASFWGNMASQHQETTQIWKQMWQVDEEREQRERHFQKQVEQADRQYELDRERFAESVRQFDANKELEELRLRINQQQVDQAYASDLMARITPVWENADYVYKTSLLANLSEEAGENEFLSPWLASLAGATPASDMSIEDAKAFIRAWMDPLTYMNEHGIAPRTSEYDLQQALSVLEGTVGYGELLEEVENTRAAREEQIDFVNTAALDLIALKPLKAEADLRQTDTITEGLIIDNQINKETAQAQINTIINDSLLSELRVREGQIQLDYLADQLATNLQISQEQLRELRGNNDLFEELVDVYVAEAHKRLELLGLEVDLTESDLRVAVMTEAPRILGEHLTTDMLKAQIEKLNHDMSMDRERLDLTKKELGFNLAAAGHTALLKEFWAELFPEFADNEEAMNRIVEFTEGIEGENRAAAAADVAYKVALTEQTLMETSYIPARHELDARRVAATESQVALGWETLRKQDEWKQLDFLQTQLNARAKLEAEGAVTLADAEKVYRDSKGISYNDVMESIAGYTRFAATVEGLEALRERGGEITADDVATLSPLMERYGITMPEIGTNMSLEQLDFVISQAAVDLEVERGIVARQGADFYYRTAAMVTVGEVPPLATYFGEYEFGASSDVMENLLIDMQRRGPDAQADRAATYAINEGYVQGNPEIFGGEDYMSLGPAAATLMAIDAMLPSPEQLASLGPAQISALYDAVTSGHTGALAGLDALERAATLEGLGIDTLEGFNRMLQERSIYRDGHVANVSGFLGMVEIPIPQVEASLYEAEGVLEADAALNAAWERTGMIRDFVLENTESWGGVYPADRPRVMLGLTELLGMSEDQMRARGFIGTSTDSGDINREALLQFIDSENNKIYAGMVALDAMLRGEEPENVSFLGW